METCLSSPPAVSAFLDRFGSRMTSRMDSPPTKLRLVHERGELDTLLRDVAAGEQGALRELYSRTSAKLYGICLRLLGSANEAEEVLQETYLIVWRKASLFDPSRASPITWLAVLARNKALDRLRLRRLATEPIEAAAGIADESPAADILFEASQDRERLATCLDELDERNRTLIRAAFLDGASYPELAECEQVPLGTMKSWIRRSLLRLRGCLER
ncbi:MAG: polymerase sigma-70 factor, subfamily [Alphaproteobacteria bacterium]|nr:polymerase sigma-70 factor, subfamily [Alphaproteobacteria bacterium]